MTNKGNVEFKEFLNQLAETNATLSFYCDFDKVARNVDKIALKLHQLNYLIGKEDLDSAIKTLWNENPKTFSVLDILIAVRKRDKKKAINEKGEVQLIEHYFDTPEGVITFIHDTGLKEVFQSKKVTNLVDYVFGVEAGLDTNARKNRSGHQMENHIATIFSTNGISFEKEVYSTSFPELKILGEDKKRFDFVIKTPLKTYLIEVNFYSGGGSKLNEVARAYSEIGPKINSLDKFEFVWITDGQGWLNAKGKLEEAYSIIPSIYNLTTIKSFIKEIKNQFA